MPNKRIYQLDEATSSASHHTLVIDASALTTSQGISLANLFGTLPVNIRVRSASYFSAAGDAQSGYYLLRNSASTSGSVALFKDGSACVLGIPDNTVWNFRSEVTGATASAQSYGIFTVTGAIRRTSGCVFDLGTRIAASTLGGGATGWSASADGDNTQKALRIKVVGPNGSAVRWVATVYTTEVTYG